MAAISNLVRLDGSQDVVPDAVQPPAQTGQASKLETVGRLASGVAHDFANILTLIAGYTEILIERTGEGSGRAELEEIRRASRRGATLIAQLLSFARTQTSDPKAIAMNTLVTEVERMLRPIIGETVEVRMQLAPGLGNVLADAVQMDQVVMNLLLNARDAMPGGGTISIESHESELDDAAAASLEMAAGPCVMLSFADTGCGIDNDTMLRLFEPFFTTKPMGRGAGLGLSTVRQIARRWGGAVWATSVPGAGATFHICLPRIREGEEIREVKAELPDATRGSEIVLIVEDEEAVRRLLTQVLSMRGYRVLEASDGEEALALFGQRGRDIELVVTDVVMPKMSGAELAQRLVELRPELPLVFMSGYPDDHLSGVGALPAGQRFLRKPLTPDALASTVREALDSRSRPFNPR